MRKSGLYRFDAGEVLFRQGELSREMYLIHSGYGRTELRRSGYTLPLAEVGPGNIVGERSLFCGTPKPFTVRVVDPIVVSVIAPDILNGEPEGLPQWLASIARALLNRIRSAERYLGYETPEEAAVGPGHEAIAVPSPYGVIEEGVGLHIEHDLQRRPERIRLRGELTGADLERLKAAVGAARQRSERPITLDFGNVIEVDGAALRFLKTLVAQHAAGEERCAFQNVQMICNKLADIVDFQRIVRAPLPMLKSFSAGERVVSEGVHGDLLYVVHSGELRLTRINRGVETEIGTARSGDTIGVMTLLRSAPCNVTACTQQAALLYEVEPEPFYRNLYEAPEWCLGLIRGLASRLDNTIGLLRSSLRPGGSRPTSERRR